MPRSTRTILDLIKTASEFFSNKEIDTARLDAEVLLAHVLGKSRMDLYCCYDQPVTGPELDRYRELVRRRRNREPVAYIIGNKEFFSLAFEVNPNVLIPRPDTELLVESALTWLADKPDAFVCDVGTGSGAIAVAVAFSSPLCRVVAIDNSKPALEVAARNADTHQVRDRVEFLCANLLEKTDRPFDLIVSNPPYIPAGDQQALAPEIRDFEPAGALFSGEDGLDVIRSLIEQLHGRINSGGAFMVEVGKGQSSAVINFLHESGVFGTIEAIKDISGIKRVVCATDYSGGADG